MEMEMGMVVSLLLAAIAAVFFLFAKVMNAGRNRSVTGNAAVNHLSTQKMHTKSEVAQHNKKIDCWIIIKDKVYDVTSYVEEHPGGDAILAHAGDDSTEGFYGPQHASRVFDMVDEFYVGDLKQRDKAKLPYCPGLLNFSRKKPKDYDIKLTNSTLQIYVRMRKLAIGEI